MPTDFKNGIIIKDLRVRVKRLRHDPDAIAFLSESPVRGPPVRTYGPSRKTASSVSRPSASTSLQPPPAVTEATTISSHDGIEKGKKIKELRVRIERLRHQPNVIAFLTGARPKTASSVSRPSASTSLQPPPVLKKSKGVQTDLTYIERPRLIHNMHSQSSSDSSSSSIESDLESVAEDDSDSSVKESSIRSSENSASFGEN